MKKKCLTAFITVSLILGMAVTLSCQKGSGSASSSAPAGGVTNAPGKTAPLPNTGNLRISGEKTYTLRIASATSPEAFHSKCVEVYKATLEDWSGGKITAQYFPASQLGGDREIFESVQLGNIDIGMMTTSPQTTFVPAVAVFDMGAAASDYDAAAKTLINSPFRDRMNEEYRKAQVELLAMFPIAYRELASSKPIRKFEDIKGLKLRVMQNPYQIEFWSNMGANPTPLPSAEVYVSLQQKLVEANENPLNTLLTEKTYEQTKYITLSHHILFAVTFFTGTQNFTAMPPDYKEMIKAAALAVSNWGVENGLKVVEEAKATLEAADREVITFSREDLDKMKAAAAPCYKMIRDTIGNEVVDLFLNQMEINAKR